MYQPKVWTVSVVPARALGTSRVSSPMPGREPRPLGPRTGAPGGGGGRSGAGLQALVGDGDGAGKVEAAVVVAELDEDDVAGLDEFEGGGPVALGDVGVAGEAADGAVDDVDLGGVEEVGDGRAPAPETVGAEAVAVADGGVADEDEGGELGVGGAGEAEGGFLSLGVGLGAGWGGGGSGGGLLGGEGEDRQEAGEGGGEEGGLGVGGAGHGDSGYMGVWGFV
jgi:hypothetical protein